MRTELATISSTLDDVAKRLSALVVVTESEAADLYVELVAAERSVNALRRRLSRSANRLS